MDRRHEVVTKPWGRELIFENNNTYCGKEIMIFRGFTSSGGKYHYHKIKDETFYSINGALRLDIIDEHNVEVSIMLRQGDSYRIKPGVRHRFSALTEVCIFIEVSTHHSDEDSYREEPPISNPDVPKPSFNPSVTF